MNTIIIMFKCLKSNFNNYLLLSYYQLHLEIAIYLVRTYTHCFNTLKVLRISDFYLLTGNIRPI